MKRRFDKRKDVVLEVGDRVLVRLSDYERQQEHAGKLAMRWSLPATVVERRANKKTYVVRRHDGREEVVNLERLLPVRGDVWEAEARSWSTAAGKRQPSPERWRGDASSSESEGEEPTAAVNPAHTPAEKPPGRPTVEAQSDDWAPSPGSDGGYQEYDPEWIAGDYSR